MRMTKHGKVLFAAAIAAAALSIGCKGSGGSGGGWTHENSAENLKGLWAEVVSAMKAGDHKKATDLVKGLLPDEASVKKALKDDVDPAVIGKMLEQYKMMREQMKPENAAKGFKAERNKVWVHPATTEQIAAGDAAASEFPGGAKKAAETVLRPKTTFYEVELTEPDKDVGTKFHLFYWDGSQWRMLGAVWRATR